MGRKSRAEIQRAYRQRLKEKNNEAYLKNERDRKNRNYVPSSKLSENDRAFRNERNRRNLRKYYEKKRAELTNRNTETETSGYESAGAGPSRESTGAESSSERTGAGSSRERGRLRVKMNFPNPSEGKRRAAMKRWKRDRSAAISRVRMLEQERDKLKMKFRSTQRSLQRLKESINKKQKLGLTSAKQDLTPGKQTEHDMTEANLNQQQREKLRRPILFANVLVSEINESRKNTPKGKLKALHRTLSGKLVKKYKCVKLLSKRTGLGRRQLSKTVTIHQQLNNGRRSSKVQTYKNSVIEFMKREDNSRTQPGKNDSKSVKRGQKVQVQILTDYLHNLYQKYRSENPDINISFATFCRCRPKYIYKTAFISRLSCLCTKHQNATLTVKVLRKYGIEVPTNPEKVAKSTPTVEVMNNVLPDNLPLGQWTRVEIEERGRKKNVTRIVETVMSKEKFIKHVNSQMSDFDEHVERVSTQYTQIRTLKQTLPAHEMVVQLDFAENFSCRSHEEVQSAYFNMTSVTLHPTVVYWKNENGDLTHKSFVTVSDEMSHKSSTVLAFLDDLIPELKKIDDQLTVIHYWSDSPSSQYRNKFMFDAVANHEVLYGCRARWNYFESGHGKGPCDGLGGTCKRMADEAIRSGKAVIVDAKGFYEWGKTSSLTNVTFRFVSSEKCMAKAKVLTEKTIKPVKGTMKLHAVIGQGDSRILTRDTSCYCVACLNPESSNMCDMWTPASMHVQSKSKEENRLNVTPKTKEDITQDKNETISKCPDTINATVRGAADESTHEVDNIQSSDEFQVGDYVSAVYDSAWYIGLITDSDESEIEVNFMQKKKQLFQWPNQEDLIWIKKVDVLCKIESPVATGKSKRMFKLEEGTEDEIKQRFTEYRQK